MLTSLSNFVVLTITGTVIFSSEVNNKIEELTKIFAMVVWAVCLACAILLAF